jgi:hypothetical protein
MGLVLFVRLQALSLAGLERRAEAQASRTGGDSEQVLAKLQAEYTMEVADGRRFLYLQDADSYFWLRAARHLLEKGTVCEEVVDGECRDTYANAPLGRKHTYGLSLHVPALAFVHRAMTWIDPARPLMASAPWLSILLSLVGVAAAFAIGRRLAGDLAAFVAGPLAMLHPGFLYRSSGADNDAWNLVLPLVATWMAVEGSQATRKGRVAAFAVAGGIVLGFHAAIWSGWIFGFAVLSGSLWAYAALQASTLLLSRWRADAERAARLRDSAVRATILAASLTAATFMTQALLTSPREALEAPAKVLGSVVTNLGMAPAVQASAPSVFQPDVLETVVELGRPRLFDAQSGGGAAMWFLAWVGLLCLLMPPRRLEIWHFGLLLGANLLFRQVWGSAGLTPISFALLLFGPVAVTVALISWLDRDSDEYLDGPVLILVLWFLASALLARERVRFQMLEAPPFALATGVLFGRVALWLPCRIPPLVLASLVRNPGGGGKGARAAAARESLERRIGVGVTAGQVFVALVALLALRSPVERAIQTLRGMPPLFTSDLVSVLDTVRETTPPDAIVTASWDYGYWIQFFGDRRTTSDGAALSTTTPYWAFRALLAPSDEEATGLLRALGCGSATADGSLLAVSRLVDAGLHPSYAPHFLCRLAPLSKEEARALLLRESVPSAKAEAVLEATHCAGPPSVVLLSPGLVDPAMTGLRFLGNWDFRRAFISKAGTRMPPEEAVSALVRDLHYGETEARTLLSEASAMNASDRVPRFISGLAGYAKAQWSACLPGEDSRSWNCEISGRGAGGWKLTSVRFDTGPDGAVVDAFAIRQGAGDRRESFRPDLLLVADGRELKTVEGTPGVSQGSLALGLLIDVQGHRVLAGTPSMIGSTLTRLWFLEGRYSPAFAKVDDRTSDSGARVQAWRSLEVAAQSL